MASTTTLGPGAGFRPAGWNAAASALVRPDGTDAPVSSSASYYFRSNGTGYDRTALQTLVDAIAAAGGGFVEFDGTVTLNSKHPTQTCGIYWPANVGIKGLDPERAILTAGASLPVNTAIIETVSGSGWFHFEGFTIDGLKSRIDSAQIGAQEDEGLNIKGGDRATVRGMRIINCGADGVDVDICNSVQIIGNRFENNGGNAVHAVGSTGDNYIIAYNVCTGNSLGRIVNALAAAAADACAIDVGGSKAQCVIIGNVSNGDARGIRVDNAQRTLVQGNVIRNFGAGTPTTGILVESGASQCNIVGNVVSGSSGASGTCIALEGGSVVLVEGNNLNAAAVGIDINGSATFTAKNNLISTCGNAIDVRVNSGRYDVTGNTILGSNWGVRSVVANGAIVGNTVVTPVEQGVDIRAAVSNITVSGNVVDTGAKYGVRLLNSPTNCTITDNECQGCVSGTLQTTGTGHHIRNRGSATPEAAIHAGIGSQWYRTDGGAGTSFYVKESGTGNTGWVAK